MRRRNFFIICAVFIALSACTNGKNSHEFDPVVTLPAGKSSAEPSYKDFETHVESFFVSAEIPSLWNIAQNSALEELGHTGFPLDGAAWFRSSDQGYAFDSALIGYGSRSLGRTGFSLLEIGLDKTDALKLALQAKASNRPWEALRERGNSDAQGEWLKLDNGVTVYLWDLKLRDSDCGAPTQTMLVVTGESRTPEVLTHFLDTFSLAHSSCD